MIELRANLESSGSHLDDFMEPLIEMLHVMSSNLLLFRQTRDGKTSTHRELAR